MFEFFSALFSQRNTIKEDKQTNKAFTKRKKEVLSVLKDLDDIDLNFSTRARLDIEKLDKILKDNEAIIELSFGNLLEEAYKEFVKNNRRNGKKATEFIGQSFLQKFQEYIIILYRQTHTGKILPEGYPKIL